MSCEKAVEGVHEDCCCHDLPLRHEHYPGQSCCWCGLIYAPTWGDEQNHGPYAPKPKTRKRKHVKTIIEYSIYKKYAKGNVEYWDGPFRTLKKAVTTFNKEYRVDLKSQDFFIAKTTAITIPVPKKGKKK